MVVDASERLQTLERLFPGHPQLARRRMRLEGGAVEDARPALRDILSEDFESVLDAELGRALTDEMARGAEGAPPPATPAQGPPAPPLDESSLFSDEQEFFNFAGELQTEMKQEAGSAGRPRGERGRRSAGGDLPRVQERRRAAAVARGLRDALQPRHRLQGDVAHGRSHQRVPESREEPAVRRGMLLDARTLLPREGPSPACDQVVPQGSRHRRESARTTAWACSTTSRTSMRTSEIARTRTGRSWRSTARTLRSATSVSGSRSLRPLEPRPAPLRPAVSGAAAPLLSVRALTIAVPGPAGGEAPGRGRSFLRHRAPARSSRSSASPDAARR